MISQHPATDINPFATRYVRPGQLPWISEGVPTVEELEQRFTQQLQCRAAIVGPHGSGKSTLLEHLVPRLGQVCVRQTLGQAWQSLHAVQADSAAVSGSIVWLGLRRREAPLTRIWASRRYWQPGGLLVLDGFEQLSRLGQVWSRLATQGRGMGLLVTSHRPLRLPTLVHTNCTPALARQLIEQVFQNLALPLPASLADEKLIKSLLAEERENMREVMMRLYDRVGRDLSR